MKEYAMYDDDQFIVIGTIKEIAEYAGKKESTIRYYASPCYQKRYKNKRYYFVRVDDVKE